MTHHFFVDNSAATLPNIVFGHPNHLPPASATGRRGPAVMILHRHRLGLWFRFRLRFRNLCRSGCLGQGSDSSSLVPCCKSFLFCCASLGKCRFRWRRLAPLPVIAVDFFLFHAARSRCVRFCHWALSRCCGCCSCAQKLACAVLSHLLAHAESTMVWRGCCLEVVIPTMMTCDHLTFFKNLHHTHTTTSSC